MPHAVPRNRAECDLNDFYAVFMKFMQSHTLCRVCLLQEDDPERKPNHPHPVIAAFIHPIRSLQPCMTGRMHRCALLSHEPSGVGSAIGAQGWRLDGERVALRFVSTCRPFRITLAAILATLPPRTWRCLRSPQLNGRRLWSVRPAVCCDTDVVLHRTYMTRTPSCGPSRLIADCRRS